MCWINFHFTEIQNQGITKRTTNYCQNLQVISWCICMIQDPLCSNEQTHQLENCLDKPSDISKVWPLIIIIIIIITIKLPQNKTVQRLQGNMFHRQNHDTVISISLLKFWDSFGKKQRSEWIKIGQIRHYHSLKPNPNPVDHYCFNIVLLHC